MTRHQHWSQRAGRLGLSTIGTFLGQKYRTRSRGPGSKTLTNSNNQDDNTTGVHSGFATLTKRISLGHPFNKRCIGSAKLQLSEANSVVLGDIAGIQFTGVVAACNTTKQIMVSTAAGAAATVAYDQGSVRLFDLNPNRAITGSNYWGLNTQPRQDQLFVSNVVMQTDVRNFSSTGVLVDLYYCTPNQHTNLTPPQVWLSCLQAATDGVKPQNLFPAAGLTAGVAGYPSTFFPGVRPNQVQGFRETWKVLHTHHMCLGPSSSESITMNINTNYLLDYKKIVAANGQTDAAFGFTNANVTTNFLRHGSVVIMAVLRGEMVKDMTTGEIPTYSQTDVGFITSKRYALKMLSGNAARIDAQLADSSVPTGALIANQKHIDADDDNLAIVTV